MCCRSVLLLAVSLSLCGEIVAEAPQDESPLAGGAEIYKQLCADCHGDDGQGVEGSYDEPLLGERSVAELALLIERTMPEDDPDACVGEQARQVSQYIFDEFYSLAARRRKGLAPQPRVELTRLTVAQHRNAVADLIGHFTPDPNEQVESEDANAAPGEKRDPYAIGGTSGSGRIREEPGLLGEYFQSRGMSKADRLCLRRIDRRIEFNFGSGSPHADISADQFTVIWDGSLVARDTGYHEFRVRTQNGARLYVNHDAPEERSRLRDDSSVAGQQALIDAWVSSGQMREESARVFLMAGRRYPLRLEFFKYLEDSASITLQWKQPGGIWEVMDHRHLVSTPSPRTFVPEVPFPPDDRSLGYERGSSVSAQWHAATGEVAVATAAEVIDRLPVLAGISEDSPDRETVLREFAAALAQRAFRRPLTPQESELIETILLQDKQNLDAGMGRVVLWVLKSPHFLYANLPQDDSLRNYVTASNLALVLWDSIPDDELIEVTSKGQLQSEDQIQSQAKRMIRDGRTRGKLASFFRHWLKMDERDLTKDRDLFPQFDEAVIADLRYSLERFVEQVVWSERSDYRRLLQADYLILNDRLRRIYDPDAEATKDSASTVSDFRQFVFPNQRRAGILTHPYLLSEFSYHNNTSPVHRGVLLARNVMGRNLKPPQEAVVFNNDEFPSDLTMREKITMLTGDSACMACHSVINPLGFALENYDPVGRWRTVDNQKPVDTKVEYVTAGGETVSLDGAVDIAKFAVENQDVHRAFVNQLFHHLVKQDPLAYGEQTSDELVEWFAKNKFNVQNLVVRIATVCAMHQPPDEASNEDTNGTNKP